MHPDKQAVTAQEAIQIAIRHHEAGRLSDAESIYRRVLEAQPHHPDALHLLGLIAHQVGKHEAALAMIGKAIQMQPSNADYRSNLGEVYRALGRLREAECCFRMATALDPDHAEAYDNLGYVLRESGRLDEAEQNYQQAIRLKPSLAHAKLNYALLQLLRGNYADGFELFEARFKGGDQKAIGPDRALLGTLSAPRWRGEAIPGKTLLLWTEQGFGDSLMMMRYLPLLRDRGVNHLVVYCHEPLVRLMQTMDGVDEIVSRDQPLPVDPFHYHCPIMSLPLLFGTRLESIPDAVPYLHVPTKLKLWWAKKVSRITSPKIGLAWAGGRSTSTDKRRSVPLTLFEPVLRIPGIRFVSLQKGDEARQLEAQDWSILDWMGDCKDFLDTAALVDQLDLVISVDTAVAHLAGALGKPVWLLNRFESDWRWMLNREDSPWYPTMRIFRQTRSGDWDDVIERVASALSEGFDRSNRTMTPSLVEQESGGEAGSLWRYWLSKLRR